MKKNILNFAISIILLLVSANVSFAQTDRPYTEGPLWQVQFVHTKPGMTDLYLKNLSENWVKQMRAAKEAGLILDFKVLSSPPATASDWDLILMYELKNHAMLDGMRDKMDAISKKVFNLSDEARHTQAVSRNDLREIQGGKLTQELQFK
ncbi:hypothetical protein [Mucilaginibacter sp.]|uniref:hypothetical protein n=1 Tax=Mucilaginibacter sp. TaxID=1882438 RepID=UPI00263779FE|nr:hypothetical protein [Mucilaginibacter sp.]MDB4921413.1 hypothetical protein [Mucilaginibacter sp.]